MALVDWGWSWDPWRDLRGLGRAVENLAGLASRGRVYPPLNVYESADAYGLEAEIPGVGPEDLELTVEGDLVTISGEKKTEAGEAGFHRRERARGKFSRSLRLPAALDAEKVEAHYNDGILTARLPKAPQSRARKIAVNSG